MIGIHSIQGSQSTTKRNSPVSIINLFDPLAFINEDGRYVVVVKCDGGGEFSVQQLPAGTYGVKYTTASQYDVDLPAQAIGIGEAVVAGIPAAGVLTVYVKSSSSDTDAPSAPIDLIANTLSASEVTLSWVTSADNIAVAGYKIYRDGTRIAFSVTNSYMDMSVQPSTQYTYQVSAYDTAGNESDLSLPVTIATPGYDLEEGLVGYWRFDEAKGISAGDSSGNNNNGTVIGPAWVTGKTGYGLDFDGIDDYVRIAVTPSLDNLKAVTMTAWIFPRIDSHWHVLDKGDGDKRIYAEGANLTLNGRIRYTGKHAYSESTNGTIRLNTWQHVALTWSTSDHRTRLYHNGVEVAYGVHDTGSRSVLDDTTHPFVIGARGALGAGTFFDGVIDEVRLYDRALNAQEARDLYNDASLQ